MINNKMMPKADTNENDQKISSVDTTAKILTGDIDLIATRIAERLFFDSGWEVADLNKLYSHDSLKRFSLKNLYLEFSRYYMYSNGKRYKGSHDDNSQVYMQNLDRKLPTDLAQIVLKLKSTGSRSCAIDYLVHNSEGYVFIEQKVGNAKLNKSQLATCNMIRDAGYKIFVLHIILGLVSKAKVRYEEVGIAKG